jgi:rSAM/selenodomain-associated transferase 2
MRTSDSISIIIPTLNEAINLQRLIPFLAVLEKNIIIEILVVDGGSTDNSRAIASQYGAIVIPSAICSRAAQLNAGAKVAKGSILYFVHADSLPLKSLAADILGAIASGYRAGCFSYEFESKRLMLRINSWFTQFNGIFSGGGDQTLFIEKSFFKELGGYDEKFTIMEDFDFVRRIRKLTQFKLIKKSIKVSDRKYQTNSWLNVQWANLIAMTAFRLGVKPERIKNLYYNRLK